MKIRRSFQTSFCKASLVMACALLFSACDVTFIKPLPDSLKTERDERLSGRWTLRDEEGRQGSVLFADGANGEFEVRFESEDPNVLLRATSVRIDESSYLVIKPTDAARREGYLLAKYALAGDRLKVWLLADDKFRQAVRDGKLKGEVGKESYAGVIVTDTPERFLDFLKKNGDDLFELLGAFEKVVER